MRAGGVAAVAIVSAALGAAGVVACKHAHWPGPGSPSGGGASLGGENAPSGPPVITAAKAPVKPLGPAVPFAAGGHPRILLTRERLAMLEATSQPSNPSWVVLTKICNEVVSGNRESGYEGEDWATDALDLALCGRVTGKSEYTKSAVTYLRALLDDKENVGDGAGGLPAVQANDGYSIRNRGFLAAIAYDWLYDQLTDADRKHAAERFDSFCRWYQKDGYKHDDPIANHYMSYFGACTMAGAALEGDDPRGAQLRAIGRAMWQDEVVPAYGRLSGGDFPEGWQYARVPGAAIAIFVDTEARASHDDAFRDALPWLRESVAFQTHALLPDGHHLWDNADWSKKPATPFPQQLYATALALQGRPEAKRALFLARLAHRPDDPNWDWLQAIADDPRDKGEDPRTGPTSYLAAGTGTVFARTAWKPDAVWLGFNATVAFGDHQHLDQGHFEVARDADALLIDPGDYDSYSTMSHNTLLVDDGHANIRWSPNQGVWGKKNCGIARFVDDGAIVFAEGEFAEAYDADGYPQWHAGRSVTRAERDIVFSRAGLTGASGSSSRVVVYDRVTLTKPSYGVTWAGHASVTPQVQGSTARITVGGSTAQLTTLLPANAQAKLLREPTTNAKDMFNQNDPAAGINSTRLEIASPKGALERRFLHVLAVGGARDTLPAPTPIRGDGCDGAALDGEAYVFPTAGPQSAAAPLSYAAPSATTRHVVTGLVPGAKYDVKGAAAGDTCRVTVTPGGAREATAGGTLVVGARGCDIGG